MRIAIKSTRALGVVVVIACSTQGDIQTPDWPEIDDPDAYVADREARFTDIVAGTEKRVVWRDAERRRRTQRVLVYLHGFSASRKETAPLSERVADRIEANLFETRLTGHGRGTEPLGEATLSAWLADGVEALALAERLGDEVIVLGVSTGGTLGVWLASRFPQRVTALVLVSPNFGPREGSAELMLWGLPGRIITRWVVGPYRSWTPRTPKEARYWTHRYPVEALFPMMSLVDEVRELPLESVTAPSLLVYSEQDQTIDVRAAKRHFSRLASPDNEQFAVTGDTDATHHVIAGDITSPTTTNRVVDRIVSFVLAN